MKKIARVYWRSNLFYFDFKRKTEHTPTEYFHAHEGLEFLYVHEGTGRLIINDQLFHIESGTLIFYQPYQLHLIRMESPYTRSVMKFKLPFGDSFSQIFPQLHEFIELLQSKKTLQQVIKVSPAVDDELDSQFTLFHNTLASLPEDSLQKQLMLFGLQFLMFFKNQIYAISDSLENNQMRRPEHAEVIMQWIENHFRESFDLDKLSSEVHLSPNYISNLFKQYTGITLTEYITKRRLNEACLLLKTSRFPIEKIASASGFADPAYFSRVFKKTIGITPHQYRVTK